MADDVRLRYNPDAKMSKGDRTPSASRARYVLYSGSTTLGEYRKTHPLPALRNADLTYDLGAGHAMIHTGDLPAVHSVGDDDEASYRRAPGTRNGRLHALAPRFGSDLKQCARLRAVAGSNTGDYTKHTYLEATRLSTGCSHQQARSQFDYALRIGILLVHQDDFPRERTRRTTGAVDRLFAKDPDELLHEPHRIAPPTWTPGVSRIHALKVSFATSPPTTEGDPDHQSPTPPPPQGRPAWAHCIPPRDMLDANR